MTVDHHSDYTDDEFGHSTLARMIRTLVHVVDSKPLTDGEKAGLVNALTRARRRLPELYTSCDLDQLARRIDPRLTHYKYEDT